MSHTALFLDSVMDSVIFIILAVFLCATLKPRGGKWYLHLPLVVTYALQITIYFLLCCSAQAEVSTAVIDFFAWGVRMLVIYTLYEGGRLRNLAIYSLFSFSNTLARLLVSQALSFRHRPMHPELVFGSQYINTYLVALAVFALLSVVFLLLFRKFALPHLHGHTTTWSITLLGSTFNIAYFILVPIITNYQHKVSPENTSVLFIALLAAVASVVVATLISTRESSQRRLALEQNAMLQSQLEMQYQHFMEMEKADAELHKLRHDIANHMLVLKDMLSEDTGAPAEYVQKLTEKYESATTAMICRNFIFNAALCRYRDLCSEHNIEFSFQIDVPAALEISNIDLMGVLSNMLSNAVNASLEVPGDRRRYVYLSARLSADVLAIAIENSCCVTGDEPVLPAEENRSHGWGIKIIKEAVEKYDGVFKLKIIRDKAFSSATMMNKQI